MVCEHLIELEKALIEKGFKETYRGQAWSNNCREWVYFHCYLDRPELRKKFAIPECVVDYEHIGTHEGSEAGFYCEIHQDGIMGLNEKAIGMPQAPHYSGE